MPNLLAENVASNHKVGRLVGKVILVQEVVQRRRRGSRPVIEGKLTCQRWPDMPFGRVTHSNHSIGRVDEILRGRTLIGEGTNVLVCTGLSAGIGGIAVVRSGRLDVRHLDRRELVRPRFGQRAC